MSAIRSALDEFAGTSDESLGVDELAADIAELAHVGQVVDVLLARKTKSLADRDGHLTLGYPNPTALLSHLGRMSAGYARQVVAQANATDRAPHAFRAWADGRLSTARPNPSSPPPSPYHTTSPMQRSGWSTSSRGYR